MEPANKHFSAAPWIVAALIGCWLCCLACCLAVSVLSMWMQQMAP